MNRDDSGSLPRWEWRLPGGQRVAAIVDTATGTESVLVDADLVSKAPRGTKPEGHVVTPQGAEEPVVVTFDPRLLICILRVGRDEVSPQQWPKRKTGGSRSSEPGKNAAPHRPFPMGVTLAIALGVATIGGVLVTRHLLASNTGDASMAGVHRAANGLFVAHFPPSFVAHPAVMPGGMSGLVLENPKKSEAIVILALTPGDGLRDPWALQKRAHGEALASVPRGSGDQVETSRSDGLCLGQPGAIVLGRVTSTSGAPALLWSCAFFRGGDGYVVMYALDATASAADAKRLRSVIDATELTRLEDLNGRPP